MVSQCGKYYFVFLFLVSGNSGGTWMSQGWQPSPPPLLLLSTTIPDNRRRQVLYQGLVVTGATLLGVPAKSWALDKNADSTKTKDVEQDNNDTIKAPLKFIKIILQNPKDSIGVQVINTKLYLSPNEYGDGPSVPAVAIQRVLRPIDARLEEGMILKNYSSAQELVEKLIKGPYPIELEFINLAGGGDAISDLGTTLVTPKDALELSQKRINTDQNNNQNPAGLSTSTRPPDVGYSITTIQPAQGPCKIQSRRGDVLELNYEARYLLPDDNDNRAGSSSANGFQSKLYDASSFRGTGRPYQMVLGSGDMIPGVDQGLYDMCPGEVRQLKIPPRLAYGPRARETFRIPLGYVGLEWQVELVSIDGTIRAENNDQSRDEREARAPYY